MCPNADPNDERNRNNKSPLSDKHTTPNKRPLKQEWSGVDRFKHRTPLPLGQALLYSNSIPTIVGTLKVVMLGRSNPFALIMSLCNYLHTHILHHFPQKSRAVCVGIAHTIQPANSALIEILCKTAENFYYDRNFCHKSRNWVEKCAKMSKSGSKNVQKV